MTTYEYEQSREEANGLGFRELPENLYANIQVDILAAPPSVALIAMLENNDALAEMKEEQLPVTVYSDFTNQQLIYTGMQTHTPFHHEETLITPYQHSFISTGSDITPVFRWSYETTRPLTYENMLLFGSETQSPYFIVFLLDSQKRLVMMIEKTGQTWVEYIRFELLYSLFSKGNSEFRNHDDDPPQPPPSAPAGMAF